MEVYAPGSRVRVGPDQSVEAEVVEAIIRPGAQVAYTLMIWSGTSPEFITLSACFVYDQGDARIRRLGFHGSNAPMPADGVR
jgi:hypothetical protein